MLNSAAGEMLPFPIAPPIKTILYNFYLTSGCSLNKKHKFVNAPVFTQTTLSEHPIIKSRMALKEF
jgi:hypothetical protein